MQNNYITSACHTLNDCPVKFGVSLPGKYDLTDKVSYTLGKPNEIWHFLHCSILHGILMCHILNDCQVKCGVSFPSEYDLTDEVSPTSGKPNEIWHFLH